MLNNLWKLCNEFDGSKEQFQKILNMAMTTLDPNELKYGLSDKTGAPESSIDSWVDGSIVPEPKIRRMVVTCIKNDSY